MLIEFTIKGTYISPEEEDMEIAVNGLDPEILIEEGQVNTMDLHIGDGGNWTFNYTKDFAP